MFRTSRRTLGRKMGGWIGVPTRGVECCEGAVRGQGCVCVGEKEERDVHSVGGVV
jgi:hypothetical protein